MNIRATYVIMSHEGMMGDCYYAVGLKVREIVAQYVEVIESLILRGVWMLQAVLAKVCKYTTFSRAAVI